jgi:hypothetical protein
MLPDAGVAQWRDPDRAHAGLQDPGYLPLVRGPIRRCPRHRTVDGIQERIPLRGSSPCAPVTATAWIWWVWASRARGSFRQVRGLAEPCFRTFPSPSPSSAFSPMLPRTGYHGPRTSGPGPPPRRRPGGPGGCRGARPGPDPQIEDRSGPAFDLHSDAPSVTMAAGCTKNGEPAALPLPRDLANDLQPYLAWLAEGEPAFPLPSRGADMLKIDLQAAGIPYRDTAGRVFDFHALRCQCATLADQAGVSPRIVQRLMRHSTLELTGRYTRPRPEYRGRGIGPAQPSTRSPRPRGGQDDRNQGTCRQPFCSLFAHRSGGQGRECKGC